MRRLGPTCLVLIASAVCVTAGCANDRGGELPSAAQMADADYSNPFPGNGYTLPLETDAPRSRPR